MHLFCALMISNLCLGNVLSIEKDRYTGPKWNPKTWVSLFSPINDESQEPKNKIQKYQYFERLNQN